VSFRWRDDSDDGVTAFAFFPKDTKYFGPSGAEFMLNFRVADLDDLLSRLQRSGVEIDPKREAADYGRFAWIFDPEGNKIELWEPPRAKKSPKAR
jgi:predicted enzyme related to lactoylglutathione lyase